VAALKKYAWNNRRGLIIDDTAERIHLTLGDQSFYVMALPDDEDCDSVIYEVCSNCGLNTINVSSVQQVIDIIFKKPAPAKKKKGSSNMNLVNQCVRKLTQALIDFSDKHKLSTTVINDSKNSLSINNIWSVKVFAQDGKEHYEVHRQNSHACASASSAQGVIAIVFEHELANKKPTKPSKHSNLLKKMLTGLMCRIKIHAKDHGIDLKLEKLSQSTIIVNDNYRVNIYLDDFQEVDDVLFEVTELATDAITDCFSYDSVVETMFPNKPESPVGIPVQLEVKPANYIKNLLNNQIPALYTKSGHRVEMVIDLHEYLMDISQLHVHGFTQEFLAKNVFSGRYLLMADKKLELYSEDSNVVVTHYVDDSHETMIGGNNDMSSYQLVLKRDVKALTKQVLNNKKLSSKQKAEFLRELADDLEAQQIDQQGKDELDSEDSDFEFEGTYGSNVEEDDDFDTDEE
jgi:hypothetical protein